MKQGKKKKKEEKIEEKEETTLFLWKLIGIFEPYGAYKFDKFIIQLDCINAWNRFKIHVHIQISSQLTIMCVFIISNNACGTIFHILLYKIKV